MLKRSSRCVFPLATCSSIARKQKGQEYLTDHHFHGFTTTYLSAFPTGKLPIKSVCIWFRFSGISPQDYLGEMCAQKHLQPFLVVSFSDTTLCML